MDVFVIKSCSILSGSDSWIEDGDSFLWPTRTQEGITMNGSRRSWKTTSKSIRTGYDTHVDYAGAVDVYVHYMEPTFIDTNKAFHLFPAPSPSVAWS